MIFKLRSLKKCDFTRCRKVLPEHCDPYVDEEGLTDIESLPGILADTVADLESGMDIVFAYIEAVDAAGHKYGPGKSSSNDNETVLS